VGRIAAPSESDIPSGVFVGVAGTPRAHDLMEAGAIAPRRY
jgi:hypothetical protein